ncbi:MAG: DUF4332 domain-containing protein, partial [Pirellulales bacterium]|nr:DUF4332 domain-containing protein [Pirellulales bacterium]
MKVTQLRLAGQGAWPELSVDCFGPELNVFSGQPRTGKSTVAQLAAHLLYGKTESPWRGQSGQSTPLAEGAIEVASPQGAYLLRRHRDGSPQGRLSVASLGGPAVNSRTIRTLLSDVSPRLLAELFAVDFAQPPSASVLIAGEFAREFTLALNPEVEGTTPLTACPDQVAAASPQVDRRRVDELVHRRDATVRQIEEQMSGSRRVSGAIERDLHEVDAALAERRRQVEPLQAKLRAAEAKLAEIAATLRYFSLESAVRRGPGIDSDKQREAIERLDAEIARCRQTLSDLQSRDATVRRELAEVHPDGTADSADCLADQRATVGVFERLLDDLDAEVSQLARSHEPGRCVGCDSHTRLSPVVQMLRQQLYTLCGQVTEQERTVRRVQLNAEVRQLARAQTDLSEQLEHLLQRRQSLVHESQLAQRPVVMLPQAPADAHCQCHGHAAFVRDADAMLLARSDRTRREQTAHALRIEQERQRDELRAACDTLQQEIETLESRWQRLQRDRVQSTERSSLDELRRELERLEAEINRTLNRAVPTAATSPTAAPHRRTWKASDALAQLTDGQFVQIRMNREGRDATIIDREGRTLTLAQLNAAQQDQLYVALTLALVSSFTNRGVDLPLILDEPFLRQDGRGAAAMAGVLDEFARLGRQVIVFTENREALRRFESIGVVARDLDALRRQAPATVPMPTVAIPPAATAKTPAAADLRQADAGVATLRIVRETVGESKPKLRVASEWTQAEEEREVYFLTLGASIDDFPVLGNDTAKIFAGLGIHTVEHLLLAYSQFVADELKRPGISAQTVRLWQSHMSLMCFVPGVSLNDAQVLAANEVNSPEALVNADGRLVAVEIDKFLKSDRGRRFASLRERFTCERIAELQQLARSHRKRWQEARGKFTWLDRPTRPAVAESPQPAARREKSSQPATTPLPAKRVPREPLRFLLARSSPVVEAPSIGATAAEHLAKVGVRTVADLLNANPESTAEETGDPRITAAIVTRWQNEARLACRIPELRCSGAQLLVASGYTEPEQVAAANAA